MNERKMEIIEKIQKILLLAKDQEGKPEGDTAKRHAAILMAKFRIDETEVDLETDNFILDSFVHEFDCGHMPQWVGRICSVFAHVFDTKVIWRDQYFPEAREFEIIGTFSDVETVMYFCEVAIHHIYAAGLDAWPSDRNWKKRNQLGNHAVDALWNRAYELKNQMDETIHEDENCTALVVKKVDEIDAAIEEMYPNLKSTSINIDRASDSKTVNAGRAAGETCPLSFAIED